MFFFFMCATRASGALHRGLAHVLFKLCHNAAAQALCSLCTSLPNLQLQNINVSLRKWLLETKKKSPSTHCNSFSNSVSRLAWPRLQNGGQCGFSHCPVSCSRVRGSWFLKLESPLVAAAITTPWDSLLVVLQDDIFRSASGVSTPSQGGRYSAVNQ